MRSPSTAMRMLCSLFVFLASPVIALEPPQGTTKQREVDDDRYVGCFKDTSAFDLDGFLERSASNTPDACIATCASKGFAYAGVQYGESCLCGNSYGRYGAADNCDYPCTGNAGRMCGGYSANSVYRTAVAGAQRNATLAGGCARDPGIEYDTNRYGSDFKFYRTKQSSCPQTCARACAADPRCRAWTFVRFGHEGQGCWLKNGVPEPNSNSCCDSGTVAR